MLRSFGTVFGDQVGDGTPRVLALPGWMRRRSDFDQVLAGLDAIALDLPGFGGASPEPADVVGAAGYADLCEPALAACADGVAVLGHSFGGRVAVHLAARHPEKVGALVLTGAPLLFRSGAARKPSASFRAMRWLHRRGLVSDQRMEALRQQRGSADYRAANGVMRGVLVTVVNESYEEQLAAIRCPVSLVWGDSDDAVPYEVAERAARLLGDRARLSVVPGAGHLTPLAAPDALRAALDRHLAGG